MKVEIIADINKLIERETVSCETEEEFTETLLNKFRNIVSTQLGQLNCVQRKELVDEINLFVGDSEVQKRKLALFCLDSACPKFSNLIRAPKGEDIRRHSYLQEDDLQKLYRYVKQHKEDNSFCETVYRIMDKRGFVKNSQIYGSVLMSRQDFSRIMHPDCKAVPKQNVWHIILGLKCSLEEADEVLFSAGYARRKNVFDLIMEYFIKNKNYDIMAINEVLDEFGQKLFSLDRTVKDKDPF